VVTETVPIIISQTIQLVSSTDDLASVAALMQPHQAALANQLNALQQGQNIFMTYMTIFSGAAIALIGSFAAGLAFFLNRQSEKVLQKDSTRKINQYIAADQADENNDIYETAGPVLAGANNQDSDKLSQLDILPPGSIQEKTKGRKK
jgi:hypothetical protein